LIAGHRTVFKFMLWVRFLPRSSSGDKLLLRK
jgi:hypothetical protein